MNLFCNLRISFDITDFVTNNPDATIGDLVINNKEWTLVNVEQQFAKWIVTYQPEELPTEAEVLSVVQEFPAQNRPIKRDFSLYFVEVKDDDDLLIREVEFTSEKDARSYIANNASIIHNEGNHPVLIREVYEGVYAWGEELYLYREDETHFF